MVFTPAYKTIAEQNGYYGYLVKGAKGMQHFTPYGRAVYIKKILIIFETDEVILLLEYFYNGITKEIELPRGDLRKNVLLNYASKGMDVFEHTASLLIQFIQLQEENIPLTYGHKFIGWDIYVDGDGEERDFFKSYKGLGGIKSEYLGKLSIQPTGKIIEYRNFINEHILNTPLELAIAVGLSAVLIGYIGPDVECSNLLIHLYGDSSTGKSTFALLAVAMGSVPVFEGFTLAKRYNGTENALLEGLIGNFGLPVTFDESKEAV